MKVLLLSISLNPLPSIIPVVLEVLYISRVPLFEIPGLELVVIVLPFKSSLIPVLPLASVAVVDSDVLLSTLIV